MEYFMILATDAEGSHEARIADRESHRARLTALKNENRLLIAGPNPMPDDAEHFSGSLIVAQFASLDDAQAWAEQDPYAQNGVYEEVLIKPFKAVFR